MPSDATPVVTTACGRIRGTTVDIVHRFLGIPYGGEVGDRRWQRSRPVAWSGTLHAGAYGPSCPQDHPGAAGAAAHVAWYLDSEPRSEECLTLNVWTPSLDRGFAAPVMVYLHGGGFCYGSGSAPGLDGRNLAARGVIVVTLNHRIGVFGHLQLAALDEEYADSANIGLIDLVDALRWVRDNIAAFGGDPECVTVFGQSGGGTKVASLMTMPEAKGLFHRAIIQSSSSALRPATLEESTSNADLLLRVMGLGPKASRSRIVESLTGTPSRLLLDAMLSTIDAAGQVDNFRPVRDDRVLPATPETARVSGSDDIPLMIGWCETERRLAAADSPPPFDLSPADARRQLAADVRVTEDVAAEVLRKYRETHPDDGPGDIFALVSGDHRYRRTVSAIADARARRGGSHTYVYRLSWRTPVYQGLLRSPHTLCLPFVFDNLDLTRGLTGDPANGRGLAEQMCSAWVSFARSGCPDHAGLPAWQPYTVPRRATMVFDSRSAIVDDPGREERELLASLPAYHPAAAEGRRVGERVR